MSDNESSQSQSQSNNDGGGCGCLLIFLLFAWYFSIWPFLSGDFSPLKFESNYGVYFYYPSGKEVYLGKVKGISNGQAMAASEADRLGFKSSDDWSYILCKITRKSDCHSKHR